jgi:hypothetical protein
VRLENRVCNHKATSSFRGLQNEDKESCFATTEKLGQQPLCISSAKSTKHYGKMQLRKQSNTDGGITKPQTTTAILNYCACAVAEK